MNIPGHRDLVCHAEKSVTIRFLHSFTSMDLFYSKFDKQIFFMF